MGQDRRLSGTFCSVLPAELGQSGRGLGGCLSAHLFPTPVSTCHWASAGAEVPGASVHMASLTPSPSASLMPVSGLTLVPLGPKPRPLLSALGL